jgi:GNAT superfamily N-acetyltransferase
LRTIRRYAGADCKAVRDLFIRVNRELAPTNLREEFESYIVRSLTEEIERIPSYYGERQGSFWVMTEGSDIVGMFGLERSDSAAAELRRMYVDPGARRRGVGRELLAFAEAVAREDGCARMILSTSELQQAAISLYRNSGYRIVREEIGTEQSNKTVGGGIRRFHLEKNLLFSARS